MISGCENEIVIVRPFGCVRLKGGLAVGVACRLCRRRSLFRKSIFPPAGTTTSRGANMHSFWSIEVVDGNASPLAAAGGLSSHTTALRMPPCGDTTRSSGFFSLPHTYWSIVTASFLISGVAPARRRRRSDERDGAEAQQQRSPRRQSSHPRTHSVAQVGESSVSSLTGPVLPRYPSKATEEEAPMVSRRVVRSYQARYSMGANKASMYDLTDAIDVHAHARGQDEEEPMHAAQEATRAGMKAILFKSISPGRPWEVARRLQDDVDRWAERESLRPVKCLSAWIVGIPLKPIDFAEIKAAVEGGILGMWMPPVTSAWSIYRLGGRGVWFDKARR